MHDAVASEHDYHTEGKYALAGAVREGITGTHIDVSGLSPVFRSKSSRL
jgi:hypothetical protein